MSAHLNTFSRLFMPWHPLTFSITCDPHTHILLTDSRPLCSLLILKLLYVLKLAADPGSQFWGVLRNEGPKYRGASLQQTQGLPLTANYLTQKYLFFWAGHQERQRKNISSSHPTHFCEGIWSVLFEVLKDLETFLAIIFWMENIPWFFSISFNRILPVYIN